MLKHGLQFTGRVVLIVDDDPQVLKMTSRMLASAGYQTVEAATPAEAFALVTQVKIDIFLLDAILPGMNGADLAEELSKSQQSATTVFMSGLDAMAVWMAFGKPCQVLQKPFSSEQLICKLEATGPVASAT